jgi:hypothetical protein
LASLPTDRRCLLPCPQPAAGRGCSWATWAARFGFTFAAGLLATSAWAADLPIEFGIVILAPFLFDSIVTLARRIARGERWYAAHRSHYYQRLVVRGASHAQVTALYAGLAVIAAVAALVGLQAGEPLRQALAVAAYAPMLVVVGLVWRLELRTVVTLDEADR